MQNCPLSLANRMHAFASPWVWLPVLVGLILLSGKFAADSDGHEPFAHPGSPESTHHTARLTGTQAAIGAAFQAAEMANRGGGIRLRFASLAESEPPDVDPVTQNNKIAPAHVIIYHTSMPSTLIVLTGARVPLYLIHQALLC